MDAVRLTSSPKHSQNPWRTWLGVRVMRSGAPRISGLLLSFSMTPCVQVSSSSSSMISWCGPVRDLLTVFLMEPIILSTAPIPAWCLGRVTLNSIEVNFKLRLEMTSLDNVQSSVNPDDARGASQSKGSIKTSGDTLGAVVM